MEKIKEFTPVILLAAIALVINQIFVYNSKLKQAIDALEDTKKNLERATLHVNDAKQQVDSLQHNMARFGSYILDVQQRIERIDLEKRKVEIVDRLKRDSVQQRIRELNKSIDLTGVDLPKVPIFDSKDDKQYSK